MSGYENAPSTKMLASRCAVCARALRDVVSVQMGIGPDCREKYGFDVEVDETTRSAANKLIHNIAVYQTGARCIPMVNELRTLGFGKVASRIEHRLAKIVIERAAGVIKVRTPYDVGFIEWCKGVKGRRCVKDEAGEFWNVFPADAAKLVWNRIEKTFALGTLGIGPKGLFAVGGDA